MHDLSVLFVSENIWVVIADLQPLSFQQALKASDGPAGWIQDDLSQGSHLQRGVRPFSTVNKNRRSLPKISTSQFVAPAPFFTLFHISPDRGRPFLADLSMHWEARQAVVRISLT